MTLYRTAYPKIPQNGNRTNFSRKNDYEKLLLTMFAGKIKGAIFGRNVKQVKNLLC